MSAPWRASGSKTRLIVEVVLALQAGEALTSRVVAERYEVSLRTAQRWLVEITNYVPMERREPRRPGGRHGGRVAMEFRTLRRKGEGDQ